jgi:hypothetical protein
MYGRKNIILQLKVHLKNHKKFLYLIFEKKGDTPINLTSNKTNTFKGVYRILKKKLEK